MPEVEGRMGVGIVGIGFGRAVHLPALRLDPRFDVIAFCASTQERAQRIADECRVPRAYGDWRQMLADPDIQSVTIAVPPPLQPPIALRALELGKHVFCEKPLADSVEAAVSMAKAADASGCANLVDFEFPVATEWKAARKMLHDDVIGPLRHLHVNWHVETYAIQHRLPSWKTDAVGGGTLLSFVSHAFHYLEWFAGPIDRFRANLHRHPEDPGNADTLTQLQLQFRSGAVGSVTASDNAPFGSGHRLEFYGERGAIHLENRTQDFLDGFTLRCVTRDGEVAVALDPEQSRHDPTITKDGRVGAVAGLLRRFADWIESGVPTGPNFRAGLRVQILLDAALRSHAVGDWVDVPGEKPHE